ncbi:MAG: DUF2125 domain-containing protein [Rickettsiales bacterium]
MSDQPSDSTPETTVVITRKRRLFLPIVFGVIVLVVAGVLISRAGLDKALVKQKLDAFIAQAREEAKNQGRDIDITYGNLEVKGGLSNKHVVVQQVVLLVKPLQPAPMTPGQQVRPDAIQVSTPRIEIYPEAMDMSALRVDLPQPINFALQDAPDKSLLKITNATPPSVLVSRDEVATQPYNRVKYSFPTQVDFTYLREEQATGAEDAAPTLDPVYETLRVESAQPGSVETHFATDASRLGDVRINFGELKLTPQAVPEGSVTIAAIKGEWSNSLSAQKQNIMHTTLNFGPLTAPAELLPYAPISLSLDATYEAAMPQTAEAVASIQSQQAVMTLKDFTLTTKDAAVKANAGFTANASDVLPIGKASIALTNVPYILDRLRNNGVLDPVRDEVVTASLQLITGQPIVEIKDAEIPIERARGGAFNIGKTTFEELVATFLKVAMGHKGAIMPVQPSTSAPQLPDPAKPKAPGEPLHDPSIRG